MSAIPCPASATPDGVSLPLTDWLVGRFVNTHNNEPLIALESKEMEPLLRIVHYPLRSQTFFELMTAADQYPGQKDRLELKFSHGDDPPFSMFVEADIETNAYAFDMPTDPEQARLFWAAFVSATSVTFLNSNGIKLGHYSLKGSKRAFEDFALLATN